MPSSQTRGITRNRDRLACTECRRRKLKCDRASPCGSCIRRGSRESCGYQSADADRTQADVRLQRLEQLVQHLVSHPDDVSYTPKATASAAAQDCDATATAASASDSIYHGPTHWSAMLEDIQELRLAIAPQDGEQASEESTPSHDNGVSVIFGASSGLLLQQVLARYLPPRQEVDRLTAAYFRAQAVAAPFVHTMQFQRLYKSFWLDPQATHPLWISILFSICHVAVNTLRTGTVPSGLDTRFSTASAHCLALGEYFRPKPLAVQALLLYAQSLCLTSANLPPDLGVIFGVIVRTATMMGYHKESLSSGLSVFEKEMRRRTWSVCLQLDLLVSFHLGLPSALSNSGWDTVIPRNLHDSDFDETSNELPAERPISELTGILFYNTKYKFMVVFEKIMRHALAANSTFDRIAEVNELDAEVREAFAGLPEMLRPRPLSESVVDSPSLIVTRLCVSALYCKCLCVLHRPYVSQHRLQSVEACYEASSDLVRDFTDVCHEFGPEGQTATERWFLSSLTWHDFLLGAMALSLVAVASNQTPISEHLVDMKRVIGLLKRARDISGETAFQRDRETRRVHLLISGTIERLEDPDTTPNPTTSFSFMTQDVNPVELRGENPMGDAIMQGTDADPLWDDHLEELLGFPGH